MPAPTATNGVRNTRSRRSSTTRRLPVLPLQDTVVYPDSMTPLVVGQQRSVRLLEHASRNEERVVLVSIRDGIDLDDPETAGPEHLYDVGTEAVIHRLIRVPDGTMRVLVQGMRRVRIRDYASLTPFLVADVSAAPDTGSSTSTEVRALTQQLMQTFSDVIEHAPYLPDELRIVAANVDEPAELCHLIASTLRLKTSEKQDVLQTTGIVRRLRLLLKLLSRELEVMELGSKIQSEVHVEMSRTQREWYLRQQLKQIQEELGEEATPELQDLREQLAELALPDDARTQVERELARIARTPEQSAEYGVIRGYLEWIASLPWSTLSADNLDIAHARATLDRDHFGLDTVKERILDYLAVSRLRGGNLAGAILCFVGPPGVGKTSLGRSIANATEREFVRISVGGVRDESEIRGHRRTYIGAMPGSILRSLRDAGTRNPVFMVDEIDKMGSDWRGDPASAMLEVLDPEQNSTFRDHYLDLPFDLSKTLFICTANRIDTIPPALRDRMEIIHIEGYTEEEKVQIARRYLIPRQRKEHGLKAANLTISKAALVAVIRQYTREAGVRELDRQIAALARRGARLVVDKPKATLVADPDSLHGLLGKRRYYDEAQRRTREPGVATGLAVTSAGGDVLYVEAAMMPGAGKLQVTGQLGQVMEESARAAVSWLRMHEAVRDPEAAERFTKTDIHIHVPAGAIPKDGPSAGVAMATALASLWRGVPVREDVAMTGELTLTGDVLPVGGVKEKALAAQRAKIRHVIVPHLNAADIDEIPEHLAKKLHFHFVQHVDEVLELALADEDADLSRRAARRSRRRVAATPRTTRRKQVPTRPTATRRRSNARRGERARGA